MRARSVSFSDSIELVEEAPPFEEHSFHVSVGDAGFVVEMCSNSSVSGLTFNEGLKRLRFSVDGEAGTIGFCNITLPMDLMSGDFLLYIDDVELDLGVNYFISDNGTHYLLSVIYTHSSHTIDVFSTEVVPDFAAWLFLPFLMTATLLGLAVRKRLKKRTIHMV
jgi:hypothetical protein